MRLGYKSGYRVPRCLSCLKYMHDPIESRSDSTWTFHHCGHYWIVEYDKDKRIKQIADSVTGETCYRCKGVGVYAFADVTGEYEVMQCKITVPAINQPNHKGREVLDESS